MGALLASFTSKDALWAGAVVAILTAFTAYTVFERHEGAQDALKPVTVLAHKSEIKVAVATAVAQSTEKENAANYRTALDARPTSIGIVCFNPRSSELPEADASVAPGVGDLTAEGAGYDPSGAILGTAAEADAQIAYLQARVIELETQMKGSP